MLKRFNQKIQKACDEYTKLIQQLLNNTPINYGSIIRLDKSKSHFTGFCNNYEWVQTYLKERFYLIDPVFNSSYLSLPGYNIWNVDEISRENPIVEIFVEQCKATDKYMGINFYRTYGEDLEVYTFSTSKSADPKGLFFLENIRFLEKYILSLKESIYQSPLLTSFLQEKPFYLPVEFSPFYKKAKGAVLDIKTPKRYFLGGIFLDKYLTIREYQCLLYLRNHLSAKDIARKMRVSVSTAQYYINNIRLKANNAKISDILKNIVTTELPVDFR